MMWVIIIVIVMILSFIYVTKKSTTNKVSLRQDGSKEVPLVSGFPIIGILPKVKYSLHYHLRSLSSEYGPLFRVRIGMRDVFILNNFETITKAFKEHADVFSWRLKSKFSSLFTHDAGIIFIDGPLWKMHRSFTLKVIREVGLGNFKYESIVQNECMFFIEQLKKKDFDVPMLISTCIANIICRFLMNKRFSPGDYEIKLLKKNVDLIGKRRDGIQLFDLMFPIFENWDWFWRILARRSKGIKLREQLYPIFRKVIEEHKKNLEISSEGEDYIDRFLIKQKLKKEKNEDYETFSDWHLLRDIFELFIAGYDSTSTTFLWGCMFMAKYPEIQEKIYKEIIEKIGEEKLVDMSDKKYLPYTQAVIDEILRLSSVIPLSIPHRNIEDAYIDGYFIPKNSIIFSNLYACHTDSEIWAKPLEFHPEHFLSFDDDGNQRYTAREELIPFGVGKRSCPGESLTKLELFIFFTSVMQKYQIMFENDLSDSKYESILRGHEGLVRSCGVHKFIFHSR